MSMVVIPFNPTDTNVTFQVTLEGVLYVFGFWYSQLEGCYYLHIGDPNFVAGQWIISSIKVQTNQPLLRKWAGAAQNSANQQGSQLPWPPGELVAYSWPNDAIATLGDLGSRVQLYYTTSDDPIWSQSGLA